MLALSIPWLLVLLLLLCILLLIRKSYRFAIGIFAVILFLNWRHSCFSFDFFLGHDADGKTLKIMTFNIKGSGLDNKNKIMELTNLIIAEDADVVFLTESSKECEEEIDSILSRAYTYSQVGRFSSSNRLYSKHELGLMERIMIEDYKPTYVFHCALHYGKDSIDLFPCHLMSNNYTSDKERQDADSIRTTDGFFDYIKNLDYASDIRQKQIVSIRDRMDKSVPTIVLGDMNDVCGSAALNKLEDAGLKDAWWEGGFGYGATIHHPLPFRIDHIYYSEGLKLISVKVVDSKGLSDHDALVAEFEIR